MDNQPDNAQPELDQAYKRWRARIAATVAEATKQVLGTYEILMFKQAKGKALDNYLISPKACIEAMYSNWGCTLHEGKTQADLLNMLEGQVFSCVELQAVRCLFVYQSPAGTVVRMEHIRPAAQ